MADVSIDQLDAVQNGIATADILKKTGNAVRNAACSFFHDFPAVVIPDPGSQFIYGLWDGFCQNSTSTLPPPPTAPFSGGQCNTFYNVHATWDVVHQDGSPFETRDVTEETYGPISDIYLTDTSNGVGLVIKYLDIRTGQPGQQNVFNGYSPAFHAQNLNIINIARVDGLPDNCGSLPASYHNTSDPPPSPTIPGGNTYNLPSTSVTFNDNSVHTYTPSLTLDGGNGKPTFNFGGISFTLDGGGLTIGDKGGIGPGDSTPDISVNGALNGVAAGIAGIGNSLGSINGNLNGINTSLGGIGASVGNINANTTPPPPPGGPGLKPPDPKPKEQKKNDNLSGLVSVQVVVTKQPSSTLEQFGTDGASNVWYIGWFSWRQAGHDITKIQITYLDSIFLAPPGVDGYSFTLTHGAEGHSIENLKQSTST